MNKMPGAIGAPDDGGGEIGIAFNGQWREFLPIAISNLVLTLATLGIYRFWAKARERRYLWSRTQFLDDRLEWTGTGKEMLIGFLIVMAAFLPPLLLLNFGLEMLILRGHVGLALAAALILYGLIFYLIQVARFRALRYRLSRSYWHGIRGGSEDPGWGYGWSGVWKLAAGWAMFGLLVPWAMTQLWNERWNKMSFGSEPFAANLNEDGLLPRWLLIYLAPVAGILIVGGLGLTAAFMGRSTGEGAASGVIVILMFAALVLIYLLFVLFSLSFYALFYRHAASGTRIGNVHFQFNARTSDWVKLILGHVGLVIVTLGIGLLFIGYRNWSFRVGHLKAAGSVDFEALAQSKMKAPQDAEGLAEAFDIGGI